MEKPFYQSKKFWAGVLGSVVAIAAHYLEWPQELTLHVEGFILAYLTGTAIADHGKNK